MPDTAPAITKAYDLNEAMAVAAVIIERDGRWISSEQERVAKDMGREDHISTTKRLRAALDGESEIAFVPELRHHRIAEKAILTAAAVVPDPGPRGDFTRKMQRALAKSKYGLSDAELDTTRLADLIVTPVRRKFVSVDGKERFYIPVCTPDDLGLVAYAVERQRLEYERLNKFVDPGVDSRHVGKPGELLRFDLVMERSRLSDGGRGPATDYIFSDAVGNRVVWSTSKKAPPAMVPGVRLVGSGCVTKLDFDDQTKTLETYVKNLRGKFVAPEKAPRAKAGRKPKGNYTFADLDRMAADYKSEYSRLVHNLLTTFMDKGDLAMDSGIPKTESPFSRDDAARRTYEHVCARLARIVPGKSEAKEPALGG